MLTTPCNATTQAQKSRAQFMLTAGGRVVRVHQDPSAGNRLMVPTEHELKTILYEHTGARNTTEDCRRERIDYVALNAQPRSRKNGSKKKFKTITGRRHEETTDGTVPPGLHHATASPKDDESREDEDVSLFFDSFSASRMATILPTSASETATGAQSSPLSLSPCGETLDGQACEAEAATIENVQATLAISEPLAQIDLYSILARAPPAAELGSAAPHDRGGDGEEGAGPTVSKKADKKHRQERDSSRKVASMEGRGERPAFKTVGQLPREEVGCYLARDPLGEEVAELDAKAQESLRRVRKDAKREKPAPTIDIGRHYAALFAEKTNPLNATKGLVDGDGTHGNENRGTNDADAPSAAAAATATGLSPGSRAGGFAHRRRFNNNRRRRRTRGKNRDGNIETSVKKGVGPSSFGAGNRGSWGNVVMHNYLEKKHPHEEVQRVDNKGKKEESAGYLSTRGVVVKGVAQGEPRMMMKAEQESNNKSGRITTDGGEAVWGNRRESEREQAQPGWSKVEDNECMGKEEAWQQQEHPPDDRVQSYSSDYSEESFELTVESEERRLAVGIEETKSLVSHGGAGNIGGGNTERREESASSGHAATVEETLSEESTAAAAVAAALRIESCWRGFLGRCAAKCALRFVLLGALRNIGGGKISKVPTLADIEREDKKGLNRALRVATLSRHQLPPQAHIAACVRFVKTLQRRRTRVVEARKSRWVAERRQRKERGRCSAGYDAHHVPIGLLPGFGALAKSNPACFTRAQRKSVVAASSEWPRDVGGSQ